MPQTPAEVPTPTISAVDFTLQTLEIYCENILTYLGYDPVRPEKGSTEERRKANAPYVLGAMLAVRKSMELMATYLMQGGDIFRDLPESKIPDEKKLTENIMRYKNFMGFDVADLREKWTRIMSSDRPEHRAQYVNYFLHYQCSYVLDKATAETPAKINSNREMEVYLDACRKLPDFLRGMASVMRQFLNCAKDADKKPVVAEIGAGLSDPRYPSMSFLTTHLTDRELIGDVAKAHAQALNRAMDNADIASRNFIRDSYQDERGFMVFHMQVATAIEHYEHNSFKGVPPLLLDAVIVSFRQMAEHKLFADIVRYRPEDAAKLGAVLLSELKTAHEQNPFNNKDDQSNANNDKRDTWKQMEFTAEELDTKTSRNMHWRLIASRNPAHYRYQFGNDEADQAEAEAFRHMTNQMMASATKLTEQLIVDQLPRIAQDWFERHSKALQDENKRLLAALAQAETERKMTEGKHRRERMWVGVAVGVLVLVIAGTLIWGVQRSALRYRPTLLAEEPAETGLLGAEPLTLTIEYNDADPIVVQEGHMAVVSEENSPWIEVFASFADELDLTKGADKQYMTERKLTPNDNGAAYIGAEFWRTNSAWEQLELLGDQFPAQYEANRLEGEYLETPGWYIIKARAIGAADGWKDHHSDTGWVEYKLLMLPEAASWQLHNENTNTTVDNLHGLEIHTGDKLTLTAEDGIDTGKVYEYRWNEGDDWQEAKDGKINVPALPGYFNRLHVRLGYRQAAGDDIYDTGLMAVFVCQYPEISLRQSSVTLAVKVNGEPVTEGGTVIVSPNDKIEVFADSAEDILWISMQAGDSPAKYVQGVKSTPIQIGKYGEYSLITFAAADRSYRHESDTIHYAAFTATFGVREKANEYDDQGRMTLQWFYSGDNLKPEYAVRYSYDEQGNCIEATWWEPDLTTPKEMNDRVRCVYTYDEQKNLTSVWYYRANGEYSTAYDKYYAGMTQTWDEHGNRLEWAFWAAPGVPHCLSNGYYKVCYEYDEAGRTTRISCYDADDQLAVGTEIGYAVQETIYDELGNTLSVRHLGADGQPINAAVGYASKEQTYDERGGKLSERYFGADGQTINGPDGYAVKVWEYEYTAAIGRRTTHELALKADGTGFISGGNRFAEAWYTYTSDRSRTYSTIRYGDGYGNQAACEKGYARIENHFVDGRPVRAEYYDVQGRLMFTLETEYRAGTELYTKKTFRTPDGALSNEPDGYAVMVKEYDAEGRTIYEAYSDADGQPVLRLHNHTAAAERTEYDADGHIIKRVYYKDLNEEKPAGWDSFAGYAYIDNPDSSEVYWIALDEQMNATPIAKNYFMRMSRNQGGHEVQRVHYTLDGSDPANGLLEYRYAYDEAGRWISLEEIFTEASPVRHVKWTYAYMPDGTRYATSRSTYASVDDSQPIADADGVWKYALVREVPQAEGAEDSLGENSDAFTERRSTYDVEGRLCIPRGDECASREVRLDPAAYAAGCSFDEPAGWNAGYFFQITVSGDRDAFWNEEHNYSTDSLPIALEKPVSGWSWKRSEPVDGEVRTNYFDRNGELLYTTIYRWETDEQGRAVFMDELAYTPETLASHIRWTYAYMADGTQYTASRSTYADEGVDQPTADEWGVWRYEVERKSPEDNDGTFVERRTAVDLNGQPVADEKDGVSAKELHYKAYSYVDNKRAETKIGAWELPWFFNFDVAIEKQDGIYQEYNYNGSEPHDITFGDRTYFTCRWQVTNGEVWTNYYDASGAEIK